MPKYAMIAGLVALSACSMTRNSFTPVTYPLETSNFDKTVNCYIRAANDRADTNEAIDVTRLDDPKEVRVARIFMGQALLFEVDFVENGENSHSISLLTLSVGRERYLRKEVIPELARCGGTLTQAS